MDLGERAHDAQARAAHSRRSGLSLSGRRGYAGSQDTERISSPTSPGDHRDVHRSADVFAACGDGAAGTVAIDATRVKGSASPDRLLRRDRIERELRKRVQRWQQELDDDPDRDPGTRVGQEQIAHSREQLKRLRESGEEKLSATDPDTRFLRERGRFVLGYTAEIAVSEDHSSWRSG